MALIQSTAISSADDYELEQSLKFNDGDSAYLTWTAGTPTSARIGTFSVWVKPCGLTGADQSLFGSYTDSSNRTYIRLHTDGNINMYDPHSSSGSINIKTTATYRDPSAWMHILIAIDVTQGTSSNRLKIYVNGEQVTEFTAETYPDNVDQTLFKDGNTYAIGASQDSGFGRYLDGYLAEYNFIDGQQLTPADFGETGTYGEWKPKEYLGSYGNNGFYLPFKNDYTVEGFSTTVYKGTGVNPTYIGGSGFRPDFTWIKPITTADNHVLYDSVRGYNKQLKANATDAEDTNGRVASANDGFIIKTTDGNQNSASHKYVAWNWDMGADTPTGFGCVTYKGNGSSRDLSLGFEPDLVWIKKRTASEYHVMFDTVRGLGDGKALYPNADKNEGLYKYGNVSKTNSDGFSVATGTSGIGYVNDSSNDYVAWAWDMGNTTVTNTSGSISSQVRANTTYGQSIVSYTGSGVGNSGTIGHGLSSAPEMVIVKSRDDTGRGWGVYHSSLGNTKKLKLDTTATEATDSGSWNNTSPTASVFSVGTGGDTNDTDGFIAYCFHSVTGYSKISSYTGNGSTTGPTVTLGFRPAFIMLKSSTQAENWNIIDNVRSPFDKFSNGANLRNVLKANSTVAESQFGIKFTDTGFQLVTTDGECNANGQTYIYMAFAGGLDSIADHNTTGTIPSYVKASTTYGQSIVSYTGTGTAGATVGHGLSSAPEMMIVRSRGANAWAVYHTSIGNTHLLELNTTAAKADSNEFWNDTSPTNSVFTIGGHGEVNANNTGFIAYAFHSVTGYSKFGSYTGNGSSSGATVTLGFRPAFIMIKCTSHTSDWRIWDNIRNNTTAGTNSSRHMLANTNAVENTTLDIRFTDTGFIPKTADGEINGSGKTYIYMTFADKREYAYWLDQSGNNNDWTSNNLTESDISVDSPTNNFATMNPLSKMNNGAVTLSEGNLKFNLADNGMTRSSIMPSSGKWYWEAFLQFTDGANLASIGISQTGYISGAPFDSGAAVEGYVYINNGTTRSHRTSGDQSYAGGTYAVNDIIGVAYDADNGTLAFYKNNSAQGTAYSSLSGQHGAFFSGYGNTDRWVVNFGQDSSFAGNKTAQGNQDGNEIGDFYYTPPTGFLALCTKNLPDVDVVPSKHFNTVLYTGDGNSTHAITGVNFQPDLVWFKRRNAAASHVWIDAVRGTSKRISSDQTGAESTSSTYLTAFNTDGFTTGNNAHTNANNDTYVAWNWKANGSGSANTNGSITSTVSANVDAGFSIVGYTGTGANATVGHGLSKAPEMVIAKNRSDGSYWIVGADGLTDWAKYVPLNLTNAETNAPTQFNSTAPTSTVFSIGTNADVSGSGHNIIAYCFHSVDGYSKVGSYTGNGNADGTFVYTGFRPAYVMIKPSSRTGNWMVANNKSSPSNVVDKVIFANDSAGEYTDPSADCKKDFFSNGFKIRTTDDNTNENNATYIYLAFAETPFKYSNAR